jgi:hypothetical protein
MSETSASASQVGRTDVDLIASRGVLGELLVGVLKVVGEGVCG